MDKLEHSIPMGRAGVGKIGAFVESTRAGKTLAARASFSLLGLAALSYCAWLLFTTAQSTSEAAPRDHRDIDSWLAFTGLIALAWLVSVIFEYRLDRDEKVSSLSRANHDHR